MKDIHRAQETSPHKRKSLNERVKIFEMDEKLTFSAQLEENISPSVGLSSSNKSRIESPNTNSHLFNLGGIIPQIQTPGGTAALATAAYFPILSGLSVFLLGLEPSGIVEHQTYPNAAELNYVIDGKVRFTVFDPHGNVETSEIGRGQVFFVPRGYFHYLENPDGSNGGSVASFFGHERPEFIGLVGGLSIYSNEVLGSVFGKDVGFFNKLPRLEKNVFIASGSQ